MSQVEIMCPNGHRVVVNVTNSTKILRILDEACLKKGFLPCTSYELRHGRTLLELSSSIQDTGLPNHAKLELVKCSKPWVESKIIVQLQTSDGNRLQREFLPHTTLFQLLESFEENDGRGGHCKLLYHKDKTLHPVVIYVKEEIIGDFALKETTLRNLGIIGGRVSLRHSFREISNTTLATIKDQILKDKKYLQKLLDKSAELSKEITNERPSGSYDNDGCVASGGRDDDDDRGVCDKKLKFADESKRVNKSLKTKGHDDNDPGSRSSGHSNDVEPEDEPNPQLPRLKSSDFDFEKKDHVAIQPFLLTGFKFPEETKGKPVYKNEISDVKIDEFKPCSRELMIYKLDEPMLVDDVVSSDDVPDNFFEVTENDLQVLQRDLHKNVQQLSDQPLMTQSMRRMEMEMKMSRYDKVIIRVQFPNKYIAQVVFHPRETVHALYKLVRDLLVDKSLDFELYTSPPKETLKDMTSTLIEANLVPMTRVYFSCSSFSSDSQLKPELMNRLTTRLSVEGVVYKYITGVSSHTNAPSDNKNQTTTSTTNKTSTTTTTTANTTTTKTNTVPRWLMLGKK